MDADLDTLATALYVKIDDALRADPTLVRSRPEIGFSPRLSDAELLTLAVIQSLLGFTSETRGLRHAHANLGAAFPYLPQQSGYNKRLRGASGQLSGIIRLLALDCASWADGTWVMDSTPVECGRSRQTAQRSDLAGWAGYGYCASHSRYFWWRRHSVHSGRNAESGAVTVPDPIEGDPPRRWKLHPVASRTADRRRSSH